MTTAAGTREQVRAWAEAGTRLLLTGLDCLDDPQLDGPSALPDWSRRHLLAHVASNAEAIGRLLTWARTGVETPMYASIEQRTLDIEQGATRPDLRDWVQSSAAHLASLMDDLSASAWQAQVVTVRGRTIDAAETVWMRAREVCIHAVDLDTGVAFADLPAGFLTALVDEVAAWRASQPGPAVDLTTPAGHHDITGDGNPIPVRLSLTDAAAWMVGRPVTLSSPLPTLPRWF